LTKPTEINICKNGKLRCFPEKHMENVLKHLLKDMGKSWMSFNLFLRKIVTPDTDEVKIENEATGRTL
jgi:hypothetical protein